MGKHRAATIANVAGASLCIACGNQASSPDWCSSCGKAPLGVPRDAITEEYLSFGYVGRGRKALPAVAIRWNGRLSVIETGPGGVLEERKVRLQGFRPVRGLDVVHSAPAAALIALTKPPSREFEGGPAALTRCVELLAGE